MNPTHFPAMKHFLKLLAALSLAAAPCALAAPFSTNANRLAYLDEDNPFYPHRDFPKLITPQWVGEPGVEAVVILAIDDMRDSKKYEAFLRPILDRLKRMDGRAPVSIFANVVEPSDPQLQTWLKEGLSLEVHTLTHPCPLLQRGSFTNAWNTYHGGVDLLSKVPGNKPVAFRMPCCDSMNSPSPRFYAEIFNRTSPDGNFLQADSSVMCLLTDDFLKRHGVTSPVGQRVPPDPLTKAPAQAASSNQKDRRDALSYTDHFRRYFPAQTNAITKKSLANFGTYLEDYPYPYVINRTCWEFPAMVPSDWEAFNAHGPTNAATVADWQLALDAVVRAQGVFTFIFHPHGWIRADQIIQFIDHAERTHGRKVKFLTFKEAVERLNKNLVGYQLNAPRRKNLELRVADIDNDGLMDVVVANTAPMQFLGFGSDMLFDFTFRLHQAIKPNSSLQQSFGVVEHNASAAKATYSPSFRLAVMEAPFTANVFLEPSPNGAVGSERRVSTSRYGLGWESRAEMSKSFPAVVDGRPVSFDSPGVRFRDFNRDGRCELLISNDKQNALFAWSDAERTWKKLPYALPPGLALVNERGEDNGLRFVDLNGDGFNDLLLSNEKEYAIYLWAREVKPNLGWHAGWSHKVLHEQRPNAGRADLPVGQNAPTTNDAKAAQQRGPTTTAAPIPHAPSPIPSPKEIPSFVRSGPHRNNGAWFHRNQLFIQNEDTAHLPDVVWRKSFSELIAFEMPPAKSPAEALKALRPRPGFTVELVAAEPLIKAPVAFDWDAAGRLWVVEMPDYPLGLDGRGQPGGTVKFLTDTDGDGRYDQATTFLDGLPFPTGVMPWRNGVLISAAPDILFAADTDGDGKADVRKVLFTGFREGNQQHRVNGFEWGLDGWIYAANGDSGGTVNGVNISGRDFRFRPDTGEFEPESGQTQYHRSRDDWGNWFGNNNPTWLWHYTISDAYLRRNPRLAVKTTKQVLANYPDSTRVFAVSQLPIRFNQPQSAGHVTSGCGSAPYRDELFGPAFATSVFACEPVHNAVHREVLTPDGATFTSRRAEDEQDREFLASTDPWFRPVLARTGPDGALYVADYCRFVLEHPEWIAPETQSRLDLRAGADKGRLYRVLPVGAKLRATPNLAKLNNAALAAALDSPNGWQRDTVQRLLFERSAKDTAPALGRLAAQASSPKVRVQALAALGTLQALAGDVVRAALRDPDPHVRVQA
ncbi:MAG: Membrane-bound dehydrogenase domain protein, partial [Limisphaerales bacterium]